ncbi:MAG: hydroxyisourate hydrolase [Myxococcota bacterium]|nr:hydroxyisourate hydrolase [Myxococcota bacterium]
MSPITTHILDTSLGKPAQEVSVSLSFRNTDGTWSLMGHGHTDGDGRIKNLLAPNQLIPGTYRMCFDTEAYFESQQVKGFYPEVFIVFQIENTDQHYHVPLLLNPFGYSTYRGS